METNKEGRGEDLSTIYEQIEERIEIISENGYGKGGACGLGEQ